MRTLVLNAGYEPMQVVSWQRALCLVFSAKAEIVAEYDKVVRTISATFKLPSIVRLNRFVRASRRIGMIRCTRKNVFLRDEFKCQYCGIECGESTITIDHVVPRSKGGSTQWLNVVAACPSCNRKKANRDLKESGMKLLKSPVRPTWQQLVGPRGSDSMLADWLPYLAPSWT